MVVLAEYRGLSALLLLFGSGGEDELELACQFDLEDCKEELRGEQFDPVHKLDFIEAVVSLLDRA